MTVTQGPAVPAPLVENPYRAALAAARAVVQAERTAVDAAVRRPAATLARAWSCPAATELSAGVAARHRRALGVLDACLDRLDRAVAGQERLVRADSWQTRWRTQPVRFLDHHV
jgi:hypothetical protein